MRKVPRYAEDYDLEPYDVPLRDAAALLRTTPETLRKWVKRGLVPCNKTPGGRFFFRRSDVRVLAGFDRAKVTSVVEEAS